VKGAKAFRKVPTGEGKKKILGLGWSPNEKNKEKGKKVKS